MNILYIHDECNVSHNLSAALNVLGHHSQVWVEKRPEVALPLALKLFYLPVRLWRFTKLNRNVRNIHYDIVHIHGAEKGWIGILGRYRYYLHCHGSDVRIGLKDPIRRLWTVPALKKAYKVFYVTPDLGECLQDIRPDAIYLPDPIRTDLFAPADDSKSDQLRILLFSALDNRIKGTATAFDALAQIHAMHPEVSISAIAQGLDLEQYRSIPWIEFLTPVDRGAVPEMLNKYDIVLGQFVIGQLGVSELESMACGKPVLCYFKYLYRDGTESPPVLSASKAGNIVDHLSRLIMDKDLRHRLGDQGRAWVIENHDYLHVARQLMDIYNAREGNGPRGRSVML